MEFSGFPRGVHATPVPDPVLGILLEQIQDLAELKVTLRGFWLAGQKKGALRTIALDEFLNDKVLVQGLSDVWMRFKLRENLHRLAEALH